MRNQIETLGQVVTKITREIKAIQMIVMGDHEVIKRLGEFPEIIKQMEDEQRKEADSTDSTSGTGGLIETD